MILHSNSGMSTVSFSSSDEGLSSPRMSDGYHDRVSEEGTARSSTRAFIGDAVTRKSTVSTRTVAWLSFCLLSALCFCPLGVHSQRAIVGGVGTRIKKTFGGSGGRSSSTPADSGSQTYILQQGEEHGTFHNLMIHSLSSNRSPVGFTALAVVLGFIAVLLHRQHRQVTRYEQQLGFLDHDQRGGELVSFRLGRRIVVLLLLFFVHSR